MFSTVQALLIKDQALLVGEGSGRTRGAFDPLAGRRFVPSSLRKRDQGGGRLVSFAPLSPFHSQEINATRSRTLGGLAW